MCVRVSEQKQKVIERFTFLFNWLVSIYASYERLLIFRFLWNKRAK